MSFVIGRINYFGSGFKVSFYENCSHDNNTFLLYIYIHIFLLPLRVRDRCIFFSVLSGSLGYVTNLSQEE